MQDSRPIQPPPNQFIRPDGRGNPPATGGYTGPIMPIGESHQQEGLDFVTITLVFFALIAVGGLVLLYLFGVFPALAG